MTLQVRIQLFIFFTFLLEPFLRPHIWLAYFILCFSCPLRFHVDSDTTHTDPYHTYLSLAALSLYPTSLASHADEHKIKGWTFEALDPLLNVREELRKWMEGVISLDKDA
jgi:prenyltransferase beta subunit